MNIQRVTLDYRPREWQRAFHVAKARFKVLVIHRRGGKTVGCIADTFDHALRCQLDRPRYAYVAPYYTQAKKAAWDYIRDFAAKIPGATVYRGDPVHVDLPNGARIMVFGADNYDALRGLYLDGVVLDEYGDMDPRAWQEVIRPALADRHGWATFIGTPKGRNNFAELYDYAASHDSWWRYMLKASESGLIDPEELADAREGMTEDQYNQEFECSFDAALQGAFYGTLIGDAERQGRICGVPYDPSALVHTAWDLGYNDPTSIWFVQEVGRELHVIDYYEKSGASLADTMAVLREKPYAYGEALLPHDAGAKELGTGRSREEQLQSLGLTNIRVVPVQSVQDGINAVQMILPRMWFDKERAGHGVEALRQYRQEFDEKRKVFRLNPLHDWTSHAADALRYFATGYAPTQPAKRARPAKAAGGWMGM